MLGCFSHMMEKIGLGRAFDKYMVLFVLAKKVVDLDGKAH